MAVSTVSAIAGGNPFILNPDNILQEMIELRAAGQKAFLLYGPPGTGKTSIVWKLGQVLGIPVYPYACNPDASIGEIFAGIGPDPTGKQPLCYQHGPALMGWGHTPGCKPGILLLDDAHLMGLGGESAMYRATDKAPGAFWIMPDGQVVFPHEESVTVITTNGDPNDLPEPVRDRTAGARIFVPRPSTEMLNELEPEIRKMCIQTYRSETPSITYREWLAISKQIGSGRDAATVLSMAVGHERGMQTLEALATKNRAAAAALDAIRTRMTKS